MIRVLFNALQAGNRSGTGQYTQRLAAHLVQAAPDVAVHVVWPEGLDLPASGEAAKRFTVIPRRGALRRIWFDQVGLRRLARQLPATLVHYPATIGSVLGSRNTVLTVHDLSFFRDPSWFRLERAQYYRRALHRSARTTRRFIADSQATADDLHRFLAVPMSRIDVIPLGVDPSFRPASGKAQGEAIQRYGLPESFLLYLGTLEPRKNLVRLVQAYDRIAAECPCDLVIAGRDGWKTESIRAAIGQARHRDRICTPGFVDASDLPAVLSAATAFVYPSLCEGFGLPVAEAMACGTPVATSSTSSLPEVAGDAALLIDPADTEAWADALRRLAADSVLREECAAKGIERARAFTWERTAQLTLAAYRRAAEDAG